MTMDTFHGVAIWTLTGLVIVLNLLTCVLVCSRRRLQTYTNGCLVSLACSDILTAVLIVLHLFQIPERPEFESAKAYLCSMILLSSAGNLCVVTYDRYTAASRPLEYAYSSSKNFSKTLILTWSVPVLYSLLPTIWEADFSLLIHKVFVSIELLFGIFCPFCFILFAYVRIFQYIKTRFRPETEVLCPKERSKLSLRSPYRVAHSESKVARVLVIVVVLFIASWAPVFYITAIDVLFNRVDLIPPLLGQISMYTILIGSLANPLLYSFMKPDFKREIRHIFSRSRLFKLPHHHMNNLKSTPPSSPKEVRVRETRL